MVAFGNPVKSRIYATKAEPRPLGSFYVSASFQDHLHPPDGSAPRNPGVDIANGACGAPLIAQCDGIVSLAEMVGYPVKNALTVRYRSTAHPDYEPAATHMASIAAGIVKGAKVTRGQVIGTLGKSGTSACHVHMGLKQLITGKWVEIDGWPFLEQNGATEEGDSMTPITPGMFLALVNQATSLMSGANFRAERVLPPDPRSVVLEVYPAATAFIPLMQADDGSAAGGATPRRWYGGFMVLKTGAAVFGWFHSSVLVTPFTDTTPAGHTDQELADARSKGIADASEAAGAVK